MKRLVSVLMPVFNMESTVEEAIQSVLVQKGTSFEIIIVNDGSNDTTPKILDKFSSLPNVTVIHQSHMGKNIAFNNAYRNAKGAFFVLLQQMILCLKLH